MRLNEDFRPNSNHLPSDLSWGEAFIFPVNSKEARYEILFGGLMVLFLPPFGWVVNLGNRLNVVKRLYNGHPCFTKFEPFIECFTRGAISASTIVSYLFPGCALLILSIIGTIYQIAKPSICILAGAAGALIFALGMFVLPGCMVIYACEDKPEVLLRPDLAFIRSVKRGRIYLKSWAIALTAIALSFLGLLVFGVGFFFSSVWAWQVAGYAFTVGIYGGTTETTIKPELK